MSDLWKWKWGNEDKTKKAKERPIIYMSDTRKVGCPLLGQNISDLIHHTLPRSSS